jgi:8-oxo-dGTP pyrophosphatase MutT (NUDIX family)
MIRSDTVKGSFENLGVSPQGKALWAGMKKSEPLIEVSSVAIIDPATSAILMGQRSDTNKWTMPGGHANPGESSLVCAMRELREEAGVVSRTLEYLGSEKKMCEDGKVRLIHAYVMYGRPKTTGKYDPDEEVQKWVWVPFSDRLPGVIEANLHSPKNVTLKYLGLQQW